MQAGGTFGRGREWVVLKGGSVRWGGGKGEKPKVSSREGRVVCALGLDYGSGYGVCEWVRMAGVEEILRESERWKLFG